MACYNAEPYLQHSIDSVLSQTYENLELIIVDDASKDRSLEIAKRLALQDFRIRVYSLEKNSGAGTARNFALSKAVGEFLAILDADDVFLPEKIEKQIKLASNFGDELILIGTDSYEIDTNGNKFSVQRYPTDSRVLKLNLVKQKRFPPHSSLLYRTDVIRKIGGYDNRFCPSEDYNLWLHLTNFGKFGSVSIPLVEYRLHSSNISKANSGFELLKHSYAASVCHNLRMNNSHDPSKSGDEDEWITFIDWISERLKNKDLLGYKIKKGYYRSIYYSDNNLVLRLFSLTREILFDPLFIVDFITERIIGTAIPDRLAKEWKKNLNNNPITLKNTTKTCFSHNLSVSGCNDALKVSVIMASHNSSLFIESSIKSVLHQTYKNLELIIVDDASDDDSLSIVREAAKNDSRIIIKSLQKNVGSGQARNIAIEIASGKWIAILDSDDLFLPEKLEMQVNKIQSSSDDLVLIGTDSFEIDASGKRFAHQKYPAESTDLIQNLINRKRFPPHSSLMYKTSIVREIGCYNPRYKLAQDYDLWLRLTPYGLFSSVSKPLVEYRHHGTNLSNVNAGFDQIKYGFTASVCHFARMKTKSDPAVSLSLQEWDEFLMWITKCLEEKNIKTVVKKKLKWRNEYVREDNDILRTLKLAYILLMNPLFTYQIMLENYWGTVLPETIAEKWINRMNELK